MTNAHPKAEVAAVVLLDGDGGISLHSVVAAPPVLTDLMRAACRLYVDYLNGTGHGLALRLVEEGARRDSPTPS